MDIQRHVRTFLSTLQSINKSHHTIRNYSYDLAKFEKYVENKKKSDEFEAYSFKELCFSFVDSMKMDEDGTTYQRRSLNRKRSSLRSFIRFLASIRSIPEDFSNEIGLLPQPAPELVTLEENEIHRILMIHNQRIRYGSTDEMKFMHHRNKLAFLALLDGCMKVSELVKIRWSYLHLEKKMLVVPKTRGLESRTIQLSNRLYEEFVAFQKRLIEMNLYHHEDSYEDYIFFGVSRLPHHHVNTKTIERMVESITEEAAITGKDITAQALRNTTAVEMINDTDVSTLTPILGFSRNSVTKHMYNARR